MTSTFSAPSPEQRVLWDAVMGSCRADDLGRIGDWVREYLQGGAVDLNFRLQPEEPCLLASVLAELIQQAQDQQGTGSRPVVCERVLATLIAHGANPLGDPETMDLANQEAAFGMSYLAEALSASETRGLPLRSADGGNLYHALATRAPWRIADYSDAWGLDRHYQDWLRERDQDGFTPLERAIEALPDLEQRMPPARAWIGLQQLAAFAWRSVPGCLAKSGPGGRVPAERLQALAQERYPELGWQVSLDLQQAVGRACADQMATRMEQTTAMAPAPGRSPRL